MHDKPRTEQQQNSLHQLKYESALPSRPGLFIAQPPLGDTERPAIKKILIANRGEIACRVIATCRKLSISTVAVYVSEDRYSRHVHDANEAISIGSIGDAGSRNPFLDIELMVSVAVKVGAQAIHPGYGYLSENADFAQAVRDAGLIFIGPSPQAMSTLGDKRSSKDFLRATEPSVPLIPGFASSTDKLEEMEAAAEILGYPVMVKASAGGGGKGMRVVHKPEALREELGRAQSEALRSFGSADCILEKYIAAAKHVEIQIVGDRYGNVVSLWERDCSVQRRHQKIIEETPCHWLSEQKRREMSNTAIKIGRLLAYEGAGTVEFVVDVKTGQYFFLEVNTRLQVEHPITEEVTGLDIVAIQVYIAGGGNLTALSSLKDIPLMGHAIECRLCGEDPQTDFFPQHGIVRLWKEENTFKDVRYETAIDTGSTISIHFDPLIAKIVVWAPTRPLAIEKMRKVLCNTVCLGLRTNLHFLQSCLIHEAFQDLKYTTSFIPDNLPALLAGAHLLGPSSKVAAMPILASISFQWLQAQSRRPFRNMRHGFRNQRYDPMGLESLVVESTDTIHTRAPLLCVSDSLSLANEKQMWLSPVSAILREGTDGTVSITAAQRLSKQYNTISTAIRKRTYLASSGMSNVKLEKFESQLFCSPAGDARATPWLAAEVEATIDGQKIFAFVATETDDMAASALSQIGQGRRLFVHLPDIGTQVEYECSDLLSYAESLREHLDTSSGEALCFVKAPMPCKVLAVTKGTGQKVAAGETVLVIESMKMEMSISVSMGGILNVDVSVGDAVDEGTVLCSVAAQV